MATIEVDIEAKRINGTLTVISAKHGQSVIQSTILSEEVDTIDAIARWILAQRGKAIIIDQNVQQRLTIVYHTETAIDADTGNEVVKQVVDSVVASPLPGDDGRAKFAALTGWESWDVDEVVEWIDGNVVDLASAKAVLESLGKAVVLLRKIVVD